MNLLSSPFTVERREAIADAIRRFLRLTCHSTFKMPEEPDTPEARARLWGSRVRRCVGRPGHAGHHGGGGAAWPDSQDQGAYPAEDLLLRTSALAKSLVEARAHIRSLEHVVRFTAQGGERSLELLALLEGDEPDLGRAVALARDWVVINNHLFTCTGGDHDEEAAAIEAPPGEEAPEGA